MISSPCSAEQAQRIKLCPRKSPPQSFPPIAQQAPGHFVRGLAVVGRHSPPPKPRGHGPPRMRSMQKALGHFVRGFPCASSKTRRTAGHAQPQGSSRGQGPPRFRSAAQAMLAAPPGARCAPGFAEYDCRKGVFPLCRFLSSGGARGGKVRLDSDLRRRQGLLRRLSFERVIIS